MGEVHRLLSFIGGVDGGNGNIHLAGGDGRKKGLEGHVLHFQLHAQLLSHRFRQFHVNAVNLFLIPHRSIQKFIGREPGGRAYYQFTILFDFLHEGALGSTPSLRFSGL